MTATQSVDLRQIDLRPAEQITLDTLAKELTSAYRDIEDLELLSRLPVVTARVPERIRSLLANFRLRELGEICLIRGLSIDQDRIGATPQHWSKRLAPTSTLHEEVILMLLAALLGDVFGWATQQNGALVHDLLPIRGHEDGQLGSGSTSQLAWHTEEAFHPLRCDYLGLMALRNPQLVGTTVAGASGVCLSAQDRAILASPSFLIRPDTSHLAEDDAPSGDRPATHLLSNARRTIEKMQRAPEPVAVLHGDPDAPYLRIDPTYMSVLPGRPAARAAIDRLIAQIDGQLRDLTLLPGDICFIDNYRAVHGRRPFTAHYDGTDRWIKRVNITRDLRRSRKRRLSPNSRIIY